MREYKITYRLSEEQEAVLMALTVRLNTLMGTDITPLQVIGELLTVDTAKNIEARMAGFQAALNAVEAQRDGESHAG